MLITKSRKRSPILNGPINVMGMGGVSPLGSGMEGPTVDFGSTSYDEKGDYTCHRVVMTLAEFDKLAMYVANTRDKFERIK